MRPNFDTLPVYGRSLPFESFRKILFLTVSGRPLDCDKELSEIFQFENFVVKNSMKIFEAQSIFTAYLHALERTV